MSAERDRWEGRPGQARALRVLVFVTPLLVSVAVVAGASHLLHATAGGTALIVRLVGLSALAMASAAVAERLARRLLPLSILLELSMLFPDRAPSRLSVAKRARRASASPEVLLGSRNEGAADAAVRILALMSALAAHDRRTRGHAERVRAFTDLLAAQLDLPRADRDKLRWAALLHDIGKLDVDAALLNKPTKLDKAEWERIKRHPVEGARLAGPLMPWLGEWGKAIAEHHERFDGTGYPMGLSGAGISRAGRIVGVVDAYETMTAARAYKKAFATRDARAELAGNAGSQFDPTIVRAFLSVSLPRMLWASGPLSFVLQLPFLRVIQEAGVRVASVSSSVAATTTAVAGAAVISLPVVAVGAEMTWTPRASTTTAMAIDAPAEPPFVTLAQRRPATESTDTSRRVRLVRSGPSTPATPASVDSAAASRSPARALPAPRVDAAMEAVAPVAAIEPAGDSGSSPTEATVVSPAPSVATSVTDAAAPAPARPPSVAPRSTEVVAPPPPSASSSRLPAPTQAAKPTEAPSPSPAPTPTPTASPTSAAPIAPIAPSMPAVSVPPIAPLPIDPIASALPTAVTAPSLPVVGTLAPVPVVSAVAEVAAPVTGAVEETVGKIGGLLGR